jgi:hypothetical protein
MKNIYLILILSLAACTKQELLPNCAAVNYVVTTYTDKWIPVKQEIGQHFCQVCGTELQTYRGYAASKRDTTCNGVFSIGQYVITKDNCKPSN